MSEKGEREGERHEKADTTASKILNNAVLLSDDRIETRGHRLRRLLDFLFPNGTNLFGEPFLSLACILVEQ
jgi:hypothetical protein